MLSFPPLTLREVLPVVVIVAPVALIRKPLPPNSPSALPAPNAMLSSLPDRLNCVLAKVDIVDLVPLTR